MCAGFSFFYGEIDREVRGDERMTLYLKGRMKVACLGRQEDRARRSDKERA
jgi:hypothetical protein